MRRSPGSPAAAVRRGDPDDLIVLHMVPQTRGPGEGVVRPLHGRATPSRTRSPRPTG